jgi:hypothetical protein
MNPLKKQIVTLVLPFDARSLSLILLSLLFTACSSAPYRQNESMTRQATDGAIRYGSIAGGGVAGFFAGKEIGGSTEAGIAGAALGSGLAYGINKFYDKKREDAFEYGKRIGTDNARAEILNDKWKREAVYGLKDSSESKSTPTYRTVYIPSRTVDGVKQNGQYQTVKVYK